MIRRELRELVELQGCYILWKVHQLEAILKNLDVGPANMVRVLQLISFSETISRIKSMDHLVLKVVFIP